MLGDRNRQSRSIRPELRSQLQTSIMEALSSHGVKDSRDCCDVGVLDSAADEFDDDSEHDHQVPIHCDDTPALDGCPVPMYDRKASGYSDANVRLSGILAVEKSSKLFIYDSQDGLRVATVCLDPGDIVIFRGDCWHAGAKYRKPNRRLHFYVYHSSNPRKRGSTYF